MFELRKGDIVNIYFHMQYAQNVDFEAGALCLFWTVKGEAQWACSSWIHAISWLVISGDF